MISTRSYAVGTVVAAAAIAAVLSYAAPRAADAPILQPQLPQAAPAAPAQAAEIKRLTGIRAALVYLGRDTRPVDRRLEALRAQAADGVGRR
jgi:hypothetical protein